MSSLTVHLYLLFSKKRIYPLIGAFVHLDHALDRNQITIKCYTVFQETVYSCANFSYMYPIDKYLIENYFICNEEKHF